MATKQYEFWNERVIQKNTPGAYTVTIPVNMIKQLRWKQGQRVVFELDKKTLMIKDAKKR